MSKEFTPLLTSASVETKSKPAESLVDRSIRFLVGPSRQEREAHEEKMQKYQQDCAREQKQHNELRDMHDGKHEKFTYYPAHQFCSDQGKLFKEYDLLSTKFTTLLNGVMASLKHEANREIFFDTVTITIADFSSYSRQDIAVLRWMMRNMRYGTELNGDTLKVSFRY